MTMKYERRSNNRSCSRLGRFRSRGRVRLGRSLRGMKLAVLVLVLAMMISGCVFLPWFTTEIAVAQTSDLSYPIVDTNQELAYDNANALTIEPSVGSSFFGQDAQIDGNQPNLQGTGVPPVPGILSILPATLAPGEQSVMLRIVLNPCSIRRLILQSRFNSQASQLPTSKPLCSRTQLISASTLTSAELEIQSILYAMGVSSVVVRRLP